MILPRRTAGRPTRGATLLAMLVVLAALLAAAPASAAGPLDAPGRQPSAAELSERIAAAARHLEVVVEEYNDSREDLRDTVARSAELARRLPRMTEELRAGRDRVGALIAESYRRTRSGPTIALFTSDTPHQFVDRLLVLNQLATEQRHALDDLGLARNRVVAARRALQALAARQRQDQYRLRAREATVRSEIATLTTLRRTAYGSASRFTDDLSLPTPPYGAGPAATAVAFAFRQLGKPYRWGASGPGSYDCSGLTSAAWAAAGVRLPHNARRQYAALPHLARAELRPGDLVFYYGSISHVAIYVGAGKVIHAPELGESVRVDRVDFQPIHGFARPG